MKFLCFISLLYNVNFMDKGVSTIEATEAAASVIYANSYMYSQLSILQGVDNTYSATLTMSHVHYSGNS